MGIFIHMSISKLVKRKEWVEVYEEALQLVKVFPFAESRKVKCQGIETICLVPTQEREEKYGWNYEKLRTGWYTTGDYETLHGAEEYFWPGIYVKPMMKILMQEMRCWMLYHIYLLAVACLIESRLGEKAFVYGNITRGQY